MKRILGLDHGDRRIGLALSDPLQIIAKPFETIDLKFTKNIYDLLNSIIKEYDIGGLITFGGSLHGTFYNINSFQSLANIALIISADYERGGFKMLPTIYPESKRTSYVILFFTIALLITSLGLYILKVAGIIYAVGAAILGTIFFMVAIQVIINSNKK